jgi:hypothetical protein
MASACPRTGGSAGAADAVRHAPACRRAGPALDRLDFAAPITYPFLAVVALLVVGPLIGLVRPPSVMPLSSWTGACRRSCAPAGGGCGCHAPVHRPVRRHGSDERDLGLAGDGEQSPAAMLTISLPGCDAASRRDTARS